MSVDGVDVKFFGVLDSFKKHGVIKCEETFQMFGHDVYGFKDIMEKLDCHIGEALRFGVHVNHKGLPQVSLPSWKLGEKGELLRWEGEEFLKAEEVLQSGVVNLEGLKQGIEQASRRGGGRKGGKGGRKGGKRGLSVGNSSPGRPGKGRRSGLGGKGRQEELRVEERPDAEPQGGGGAAELQNGELEGGSEQAAELAGLDVRGCEALQAIAAMSKAPPLGLQMFDREYSVSCDLPSDKVEYMSGLGGEQLAEVQEQTGTRLKFEEVDGELHRLEIQGPLLGLYQAHSLMMGRYHEALALAEEVEAAEAAEAREAAEAAELFGAMEGGGAETPSHDQAAPEEESCRILS